MDNETKTSKQAVIRGQIGNRAFSVIDTGYEYLAGVGEKTEQGKSIVTMPFRSIAGALYFIRWMLGQKTIR